MPEPTDFWTDMARPGPRRIVIGGAEVRAGTRVLIRPRARGDVLDVALAGRTARVEEIVEDVTGVHRVAVTIDDDPGRDLGNGRFPGHRFYFAPDELEPVADGDSERCQYVTSVLVAGIGNVFLGDDGFGVAVARRLAERELPSGVDVVDFGVRGLDLTYALLSGYDAAILVDAMPAGDEPGTLRVIEPEILVSQPASLDTHAVDPVRVLRLAASMGTLPPLLRIVGCEPATSPAPEDFEDVVVELSEPVRRAVATAVELVEAQLAEWLAARSHRPGASRADPPADPHPKAGDP